MRNSVLVCVLDALSADMVPALVRALGEEPAVCGSVVPPFSFEPDAAFLCGRYPEETDSGTHFWYAPESSPFYWLKGWGGALDRLPHLGQLALRRALRLGVRRRGKPVLTARIPFALLPYFDAARSHYPTERGFSDFPTVFDLLSRQGRRFLYLGAPVTGSRSENIWEDLCRTSTEEFDLVYLFAGDLDEVGHQYGPDSAEYEEAVLCMGEFIQRVRAHLSHELGGPKTLIFGDHGMVGVHQTVDVLSVLKSLPLQAPRDYLYFLDSTLARFWFFNDKARQIVSEAMSELKGGRLVSEDDRNTYQIRYPHDRFGELIWWADSRTIILPNFWQGQKPVKGMHGYRQEVRPNHAGFVLMDRDLGLATHRSLAQPIPMTDLFATMLGILGLEMPAGAYGTSVCERIT